MMDAEKVSKLRIAQKEDLTPGRRGKWKYVVLVLLTALVAATVALLYTRGLLTPATPVQVTSVNWVYPSQILTEFSASGYVVAQRRASVASKGTGRLEYLGVREGSQVKEGQVLAGLEADDLKAEVSQIEAQLAAARSELARAETDLRTADRNYRRYQNLHDQHVVAQVDFESTEDQYHKTKALVEAARANIKALEASLRRSSILLDYTIIRAPFDGVVLTKDADIGEVVAPFGSSVNTKAAVVTMADMSSLMVQADVAESFISKVREEQRCEIQLDSLPDARFPGQVATIVPTADRTRGTVLVKVRFDALDPRILPEMSARVAFLSRPLTNEETRPLLAVHRDAIAERGGIRGVFAMEEDRARWVPFPSPELFGDYLLVAPALRATERLVLKPPAQLNSGDRIEVAE